MSTNNPFRKHVNNLFANRGCDIDQALEYAQALISSKPNNADAMTALMVVINTAANAFDQAQGPSPERLAVQDMVRTLVDQQLAKSEDRISQAIDDWMSDNLESRVEEALDNQLDDRINDWLNDNLESKMEGEALCEAIRDAFRNNLTISIC